jgi:hypothetical protein
MFNAGLIKNELISQSINKCEQKRGPSEKWDGNCHVFANSCWEILPPLLLEDRGYMVISQRLPVPFKNCPEAFQYPLGISQRLSYTLSALPSSC